MLENLSCHISVTDTTDVVYKLAYTQLTTKKKKERKKSQPTNLDPSLTLLTQLLHSGRSPQCTGCQSPLDSANPLALLGLLRLPGHLQLQPHPCPENSATRNGHKGCH